MAVIKSIANLNEEEAKGFEEFCVSYFRKEYIKSNVAYPHLSMIDTYLGARKRTLLMMRDIATGVTTGFVAYDFDFTTKKDGIDLIPVGLIVGYDTPAGMNNLMHFFVKDELNSYPRLSVMKELLSSYVEVAKTNGSRQIQTTSDIYDPRLTQDLKDFDFAKVGNNGTEEIYKRAI